MRDVVISLSLLIVLTHRCQEVKLKAAIEVANTMSDGHGSRPAKSPASFTTEKTVVYTFHLE